MDHVLSHKIKLSTSLFLFFVIVIVNGLGQKSSDNFENDLSAVTDLFMQLGQLDGLLLQEKKKLKKVVEPPYHLKKTFSDGVPFSASINKLVALADAENKVYKILTEWVRKLTQNTVQNEEKIETAQHFLLVVQRYISDYDASTESIQSSSSETNNNDNSRTIAENPLASFLMLRRFVGPLTHLLGSSKHNFVCEMFHEKVDRIRTKIGWPTEKDKMEAANRILRIQQVYNLNAKDIFEGKLVTVNTNVRLSLSAAFVLAKVALQNSQWTLSIDWLQLLESKLKTVDGQKTKFLTKVQKMKTDAVTQHDVTWTEMNIQNLTEGEYHYDQRVGEALFQNHLANKNKTGMEQLEWPIPRRLIWPKKFRGDRQGAMSLIQYWSLCSKDFYQSEEVKSKLFCWLETAQDLTWLIRPLKMEFLSRSPDVVQIYQVLGDQMIEEIKMKALTKFSESEIGTTTTTTSDLMTTTTPSASSSRKTTTHRSSIQAWLEDIDDFDLTKISNTVSKITGLQLGSWSTEEELQVLSYSPGGHFVMHKDAIGTPGTQAAQISDERIATFMFYLSNVHAGGGTAFRTPGVTAEAVKGSSIFWYNTNSDGQADVETYHAGCPVILGQKWAANKWILYSGQFTVRKCGLKPGTNFRVSVNGVS